jgi:hypothetical protein
VGAGWLQPFRGFDEPGLAGKVSSKSFRSNSSIRSGEANAPKFDKWRVAAQLGIQRRHRRGRQVCRHDLGRAAVERERRDHHPAVPDRYQVLLPGQVALPAARPDPGGPRPGSTRMARQRRSIPGLRAASALPVPGPAGRLGRPAMASLPRPGGPIVRRPWRKGHHPDGANSARPAGPPWSSIRREVWAGGAGSGDSEWSESEADDLPVAASRNGE